MSEQLQTSAIDVENIVEQGFTRADTEPETEARKENCWKEGWNGGGLFEMQIFHWQCSCAHILYLKPFALFRWTAWGASKISLGIKRVFVLWIYVVLRKGLKTTNLSFTPAL